jgi:hypothetical protein
MEYLFSNPLTPLPDAGRGNSRIADGPALPFLRKGVGGIRFRKGTLERGGGEVRGVFRP